MLIGSYSPILLLRFRSLLTLITRDFPCEIWKGYHMIVVYFKDSHAKINEAIPTP